MNNIKLSVNIFTVKDNDCNYVLTLSYEKIEQCKGDGVP